MCLDSELNRSTKPGVLGSVLGPGVGPLYSDSHLLGTVWDWGAVGQGWFELGVLWVRQCCGTCRSLGMWGSIVLAVPSAHAAETEVTLCLSHLPEALHRGPVCSCHFKHSFPGCWSLDPSPEVSKPCGSEVRAALAP